MIALMARAIALKRSSRCSTERRVRGGVSKKVEYLAVLNRRRAESTPC
jgi:hypothetical protein